MKVIFKMIVITILFLMPVHVFASNQDNADYEKQMIDEIEIEKKKERENILKQLEEQDAVEMLDVYEEIIYPEIEDSIRTKYAIKYGVKYIKPYSQSYIAPNGGVVSYLNTVNGYKSTEAIVTYLDKPKTIDFVFEWTSFSMGNIVKAILGYLPRTGSVSSFLFSLESISKEMSITNINNCDRHAKIINTYSRIDGTTASVVTGWCNRYNIVIPQNASDVNYTEFK